MAVSPPAVETVNCVPETPYCWPESDFYVSEKRRLVYCPIQKVACSSLKLWWADLESGTGSSFTSVGKYGETIVDHGRLNQSYKLHQQSAKLGRRPLTDDGWLRVVFVRNPWSRLVSAFVNKFPGLHELTRPVFRDVHRRWRRRALRSAGNAVLRSVLPKSIQLPEPLRQSIWPLLRGRDAWSDEFTFRHFVDLISSRSIEEDMADVHWCAQYRFLGDVSFHFVGRFERLADDLKIISGLLGVETPLPAVNVTKYTPPSGLARSFADAPLSELRQLTAQPDYRQFYTRELRDQVGRLYRRDIEQFGYSFDT